MPRHKKLIGVFAVLCGMSFLVAWDVHTLHRGATAPSQFDDGMAGVRRYGGEEGVFRVLFDRLRDPNEANNPLAAKSLDLRYARIIDSVVLDNNEEENEKSSIGSERRGERANTMSRSPTPGDVEINEAEASSREIVQQLDESSPSSFGHNRAIRTAEEATVSQKEKTNVNSQGFGGDHKSSAAHKLKLQHLQDDIEAILNSTHPVSRSQQQKTAVETIKKLLLRNETESARVLWVMAQEQHLSHTETPTAKTDQSQSLAHRENKKLFHVRSSMSWPVPQFTRSDVLQSRWVQELKTYLEKMTTWRQISVVTANQEHQEVVLNWLVSALTVAGLPLERILVLSLSVQLHDLLTSKKVNSVYIPPASVITDKGLKHITTAFNQIHIVRLTLFRLMNHWKYDVVMYDSDAVVLKDPQPLFDSYPGVELVGSAGKGPESIGRIWGRTICTGVLLMHSSLALESWWEKMSQMAHLPFTDQGLVNLALKSLHVRWDKQSPLQQDRDMRGSCPDTKLQAVVLSEEKICRYSCDNRKRAKYYVWHKPAIKRKRTVENKKKRAREGGAWFLRDNWAEVSKMSSLTGVTWLLAISHNT